MFDLGWSEMGVVLLVALLILGPKELPKLARDLGRWVGKARALSREFQRSLEEMAREAELDDVKKQLDAAGRELRNPQIGKRVEREIDPDGELRGAFDVEGTAARRHEREEAPPPAGGPAPRPEGAAERAPAPQSAER